MKNVDVQILTVLESGSDRKIEQEEIVTSIHRGIKEKHEGRLNLCGNM